jgi:hypothetical protein
MRFAQYFRDSSERYDKEKTTAVVEVSVRTRARSCGSR